MAVVVGVVRMVDAAVRTVGVDFIAEIQHGLRAGDRGRLRSSNEKRRPATFEMMMRPTNLKLFQKLLTDHYILSLDKLQVCGERAKVGGVAHGGNCASNFHVTHLINCDHSQRKSTTKLK